jgi:nickel-dependent lactate racemase
MRIAWGPHSEDFDLPEDRLAKTDRAVPRAVPPVVTDLAAAVTAALETPFEFPSLRRALTPEDHVVIVLDPALHAPARFLTPLLRYLREARIDPAAVTILCLSADQDQLWVDDLPDEFQEVRIETHNPGDRKALAYLATTQAGRRIYLNRTAVDADQVVVLTRRGYDSLLGHAGGPGVLYPGLSDNETWQEIRSHLSMRSPQSTHWKVKQEADEVCWLLGAPFFVQVIEGPGDTVSRIVGGTLESCREAERLMDADWKVALDEPVDLAIATITGEPAHQTLVEMARALAHASRLVKPSGRVVLLCDIEPELGPSAQIIRDEEEIHIARHRLHDEKPPDLEAGYLWITAAEKAKLYVLSQMSPDTIEEMFATPLDKASQIERLAKGAESFIVLPDAHKTFTLLNKHAER